MQSLSHYSTWTQAGRNALVSGSIASVLSTAALALAGHRTLGHASAPTNATSHWLWGTEAYRAHSPSLRHTGLGYLTHHASAVFWALFCERWLERRANPSAATIVGAAAATTATAAFVDYVVTPKRLRPGFEQHLSLGAMVGVFAAIGAGIALGAALNRRQERRWERLRML